MSDLTHFNLTNASIKPLLDRLLHIHEEIKQQANERLTEYGHFLPAEPPMVSAMNLAHYLALRSFDLRELQDELRAIGLSSLGRGEAGVIDNLHRVIRLLCCLLGEKEPALLDPHVALGSEAGEQLLRQNTDALLGEMHKQRDVRIMVTLPSSAATDFDMVMGLLESGMDCARINCAHDDHQAWQKMVGNVRQAELELGKPCKIMMDLAGQKIRTGPIEPGPAIYHLKVKRDEFGNVVSPAYLQIETQSQFQSDGLRDHLGIGIDDAIQADLEIGDRLNLVDNRGKHRQLEVFERREDGVALARCWQTAYLSDKTIFQLRRKGSGKSTKHHLDIRILRFVAAPAKIRVFKDDRILLTSAEVAGRPTVTGKNGEVVQVAQIGISHSEVLAELRPGASVWIDDGKIGTLVEAIAEQGALLRVTHARAKGTLIRSDKGVNFPDTELSLPALTDKDMQDLRFIVQHADIVGYSFVQSRSDMDRLMSALQHYHAEHLAIIAKIETAKAVKNLPEIILSVLGRTKLGVMIARGDLAVELGSVRMAEIQEEILWLCEAAHVPVVWATQVLETLAKEGIHSRPEITDAAMSVRAECVMLNKGAYIKDALTALDDILVRMQAHQHKKTSLLRALQQWPMPVSRVAVSEMPMEEREKLVS